MLRDYSEDKAFPNSDSQSTFFSAELIFEVIICPNRKFFRNFVIEKF